jgi:hypothetical protein
MISARRNIKLLAAANEGKEKRKEITAQAAARQAERIAFENEAKSTISAAAASLL